MKSGNLNFLKPSGPLQASNGADLPLPSTNVGVVVETLQHNHFKICAGNKTKTLGHFNLRETDLKLHKQIICFSKSHV